MVPSVTEPSRAVFLSYASEDAPAAQRIAEALRSAGIEVWFDREELRGGDAWDRRIREQVQDCRLFIAVISANTEARDEGYFRREWKLAVDRTHDMAEDKAFVVPVAIDGTNERSARVPDAFKHVQWTRLPGGEVSPAFVERVRRLLSPAQPDTGAKTNPAAPADPVAVTNAARLPLALQRTTVLLAIVAVALLALGYLAIERLRSKAAVQGATSNSIAVLPLTNESGDPSQLYFSDGLSEDLITALSQFAGLKVIGRTSSFQFRDSKDDSKTIGAKLGVAHLLEGSVHHAGDIVRVSAELVDTSDGTTQWSERYDRPYKDLFALQDDITRAVAGALKTHLLPGTNTSQQNDRPPSGNLDAYTALLEGKQYYYNFSETNVPKAMEHFARATQLDPRYALAWSYLSRTWIYASTWADSSTQPEMFAKARSAADTALALAPDLAAAHVARGFVHQDVDFDWRGAEAEYQRAVELDPEDGGAKFDLGGMLAVFGQLERAIELIRQAIPNDPLRGGYYLRLAAYYSGLSRLDAAEEAARRCLELQPGRAGCLATLVNIEILRGDAQRALTAAHRLPSERDQRDQVAKTLQIGNDRAAADAALKNVIERDGSYDPYLVARIYAIRNDADKTFEWLDRAWGARDSDIQQLLYDPFLTRYKNDPRFATFCRKVGLPTPAEVEGRK